MEIIHIGFSKCASTYLQAVFKNNDGINYIYKSKRFSLLGENKSPTRLFDDRVNIESDEHIILPNYHPKLKIRGTVLCDVQNVINNIHKYNSDSKILLVIRNHLDLLRSRYSQYIVGGGGTEDIDTFITKLNGFDDDNKYDFFQNHYYEISRICESIFGKNNFLLVLFEDIKSDSSQELKKIGEFIGVSLSDRPKSVFSMRKGLSASAIKSVCILNRIFVLEKQDYKGNKKLVLPSFFYSNLLRSIRLIDYCLPRNKLQVSEIVSKQIQHKFKNDNAKMQNWLGRDISRLGYYL